MIRQERILLLWYAAGFWLLMCYWKVQVKVGLFRIHIGLATIWHRPCSAGEIRHHHSSAWMDAALFKVPMQARDLNLLNKSPSRSKPRSAGRAGLAIRLKGWSLGPPNFEGPPKSYWRFLSTVITVNRGFASDGAQQQRPVNEGQRTRGVPDIKHCLLSYQKLPA